MIFGDHAIHDLFSAWYNLVWNSREGNILKFVKNLNLIGLNFLDGFISFIRFHQNHLKNHKKMTYKQNYENDVIKTDRQKCFNSSWLNYFLNCHLSFRFVVIKSSLPYMFSYLNRLKKILKEIKFLKLSFPWQKIFCT